MYPIKQSAVLDVLVFAFDSNGDGVTGKVDADFTKRISKNGGVFAAMTVTITERENGFYHFQLSAAHSDTLGIMTVSLSSSGIKRVNLQYRVHARLPDDLAFPTTTGRSVDVTATGEVGIDLDNTVGTLAKGTDITGFNDISTANVQTELTTYGALKPTVAARTLDVTATGEAGIDWANIGAPTTSQTLSATTIGTVTNLTNDPPGVTTLLGRVTATLFTGITSLKEWLGLLAGKQVGNATARTEIRSSGAGSGRYDETTDSQEATRDRGDAAWITGAGGDPWLTIIPAAYGAGTAGNIIGNNLNATVSSRASQASVDLIDDFVDSEVLAIKSKTDQLAFTGATVNANATIALSAADLNAIADALLKRDMSAVTGEAARSPINALRTQRNRVSLTAIPGSVVVYKEDDVTIAWQAPLTTDASALPITGWDPT